MGSLTGAVVFNRVAKYIQIFNNKKITAYKSD
jgi:hypothetical protein